MLDDPEIKEYGARPAISPGLSPSGGRTWHMIARPLGLILIVTAGLTGLLALLVWVAPPPSRESPHPTVADNHVLSDVRGQDQLHRLEVTQAALKREMALLREWVSKGEEDDGALSAHAALVRTVAELQADQALFGSMLRELQWDQERLARTIEACQVELAEQSQRAGIQEQPVQGLLSEERN